MCLFIHEVGAFLSCTEEPLASFMLCPEAYRKAHEYFFHETGLSREVCLPPAQCPQILGMTNITPMPGLMLATSGAESSGLEHKLARFRTTQHWAVRSDENPSNRKYRSVRLGSTKALALIPRIALSKSPLYGSWFEQSPACQVCSITNKFSGSNVGRIRIYSQPKRVRGRSIQRNYKALQGARNLATWSWHYIPLEHPHASQKFTMKSSRSLKPKTFS